MDIKYLISMAVIISAIGGWVFAAEDRYLTQKESNKNTASIQALIKQNQIDDLSDDIDYLSDKQLDGIITRSEEKKLGRKQRRLDAIIKGQ